VCESERESLCVREREFVYVVCECVFERVCVFICLGVCEQNA